MKKINLILFLFYFIIFLPNIGCWKEKNEPPVISVNPNGNDPVAKAGNDITILLPSNRAKLDGSASYALNSSISTYRWTKVSGPGYGTIVNPDSAVTSVTDLVKGVYEFMLTVTNTTGKASTDICVVRVDTVINTTSPPGAFFWISLNPHDTVLNLPVNTVTLTVKTWSSTNEPSQPTIASIEWKKVSGPNNYNIQSPGTLSTAITGLSDGLYAFQCKITDTSGWSNVSYGGVINVTDTITPGHEIFIPDQSWDGNLGGLLLEST